MLGAAVGAGTAGEAGDCRGSGVAADQSGPWVGPRGEVGDREVSWGCGELGAVAGAPSTLGSAALRAGEQCWRCLESHRALCCLSFFV